MVRKKEYSTSDGAKNLNSNNSVNNRSIEFSDDWNYRSGACNSEAKSPVAESRNQLMSDVNELRAQLRPFGLTVRDIPGDGNCLFRALGDQLDGHIANHLKHRLDTAQYMRNHRSYFEPFIDVPFERYVEELGRVGTHAGQDALVAFARLHKVNILIHQINRPVWQIQGSDDENALELHLSYHNSEHYSSVRRCGDFTRAPAGVRVLTKANDVSCCASDSAGDTKINTSPIPVTLPPSENVFSNSVCALPGFDNFSEQDRFEMLIDEVMRGSGCENRELATEVFLNKNCDTFQAIDYLISLCYYVDESDVFKKDHLTTADSRIMPEDSFGDLADTFAGNLSLRNTGSLGGKRHQGDASSERLVVDDRAIIDDAGETEKDEKRMDSHT